MTAHVSFPTLDRLPTRSRMATIVVFAVGYAIWQPVAQLLLRVFGDPLPFQTTGAWLRFEAAIVVLGAAVGTAWFSVQRLPSGWTRAWLDNSLRMTALACIITARSTFERSVIAWVIGTIVSSAALGALWVVITRAWKNERSGAAV